MDSPKDYYAILGLMPDAEDVVISAAYRVLISRYHPDKWKGDPAVAHQKSVELNEAYSVLSDPEKRREYDISRNSRSETFAEFQDDEEVDDALNELEVRWQIAVDVFPDLQDLRKKLARTAHRLAFAYVILLLEKKQFAYRKEIATKMERDFLGRYFGSNPDIIRFAKRLIKLGLKDAVHELNTLVDVLGDQIDPKLIINKIDKKYSVSSKSMEMAMFAENELMINKLRLFLKDRPYVQEAIDLARALGYEVEASGGSYFKEDRYKVFQWGDVIFEAPTPSLFVKWVRENLL